MFLVRGREVRDAVVAESEGEAGVDHFAEAAGGFGRPFPEGRRDVGFIVRIFPRRVRTESLTEGGGFSGRFWLLENGGVAELHVDFHQYQAAEQKAVLPGCLGGEEIAGDGVIRGIRIGRVEKELGVGGENHEPERL